MSPVIKPVPPEIHNPNFLIVGEQPAREETRVGRPFVGPAGRLSDRCLAKVGLKRRDVSFDNFATSMRPHLNKFIIGPDKGGPKLTELGKQSQALLIERIVKLKPKVIVTYGNVPTYAITNRWGISKWRGSIIKNRFPGGFECYVVPAHHPATVIPPKNVYTNKLLIEHSLTRARDIANGLYKPTERELIIEPTFDETMQFLHYIAEQSSFAYDIEVFGDGLKKHISCISLSSNLKAICIPFIEIVSGSPVSYFSAKKELSIWLFLAKLFEDHKIKKIGQNLCFDAHFIFRRYGIVTKNMEDTMIAARTLMGDYPIGLDFICAWYTDIPYYKDDGKDFLPVEGNKQKLWVYNSNDSLVCDETFPKQHFELASMDNLPAYERQRNLIEPLAFMMEYGTLVDVEGMMNAYTSMEEEEKKTVDELLSIVRTKASGEYTEKMPGSSPQLKKYFHEELGVHKYKTRQRKVGFDKVVLKRLIGKGFKEAKLIMKRRKLRKARSTYLDIRKVDLDGRLRCQYKPAGTRFSRLASDTSIFGTGMNRQNWPKKLLRYLIPDPGYVYYSIDLSQAENRIVAYLAGCRAMMECFGTGQDVHSLTAALIFNEQLQRIIDEYDNGITCDIGNGDQTKRYWGKKTNHSMNYDIGYVTFSVDCELEQAQGKQLVMAYHRIYPEIRQIFHSYIRRCLRQNRTIVNLMGRKTKFYGKLDDKTFRKGYNCIPQGTVGDIINEFGLLFIYYNSDPKFQPLILLDQVHDSVGFQYPLNKPWEDHAYVINEIIKSLEVELTTHLGHKFVIPCDLTIGKTLGKHLSCEVKRRQIPDSLEQFGNLLKKKYEEL